MSPPPAMSVSEAAATDRIESHVWRIAFVVIIGSIMSILDTTIVNVALEKLGQDLHKPIADTQWVITAGSALCGVAQSLDQLIVFRVIQGIGGGMILPLGQLMMATAAGPKRM